MQISRKKHHVTPVPYVVIFICLIILNKCALYKSPRASGENVAYDYCRRSDLLDR